MIPYGRQTISDQDVAAVVEVLRSDFLTQGPVTPRFEREVAVRCNVAHAVAVNSATSALHVACMALDVGVGDRVWTSPITFVASANCAVYCGATVDFVDIDPLTYNMSVPALAHKLEEAARRGTLPKVLIPVHFAGTPCDLAPIHALAQQYNVRIIEDASHAIGARYRESVIGDCRYSDIAVFSFHPVKIVTTAEGGMATTQSSELARRMAMLRTHGITRETARWREPGEGAWYYEQHELGFNYRLTDLQSALGLSQLSRIGEWIERRHAIADVYDETLRDLPLQLPVRPGDSKSALHLYVIQVDTARAPLDRRALFDRLRAGGIGVNVHYIPVHLQPYYRDRGFNRGQFPASETYYERCVSLPIYPMLTPAEQQYVVQALHEALL